MTEITDLSTTDASNTTVTGESLQGNVANMGRMDNTLQAIMGLLARSIRTNVFRIIDSASATKKLAFSLTGLTAERTLTIADRSGTISLTSDIRGQIYGLTLSNNASDATNDIDIAAGAAVDSTGTTSMVLSAALTKRLDATWVAGTNQGGRFYTTLASTGWAWLFLIFNPTTGVTDVGFSDNATNPTAGASYPAGFTLYRYIGAIYRDAGTNTAFTQVGNQFLWSSSRDNLNLPNSGTTAFLPTLTVPPGRKVDVLFTTLVRGGASPTNFLFTSPDQADVVPTGTSNYSIVGPLSSIGVLAGGQFSIRTNTTSQIRVRLDFSDPNVFVRIATNGYIDMRDQY